MATMSGSATTMTAIQSQEEERDIKQKLKECRRLTPTTEADELFWKACSRVAQLKLSEAIVRRRTSQLSFSEETGKGTAEFDETAEGKRLAAQIKLVKKAAEAQQWQADRMSRHPERQSRASADGWIQLFRTSPLGMGQGLLGGPRNSITQDIFREKLIKASVPADKPSARAYCIIFRANSEDFIDDDIFVAAHVVNFSHRESIMKSIFGRSELFDIRNGIYMCKTAEKMFDQYLWALVPDIVGDLTPAKVIAWQAQKPREYRIRVMRPDHPLMRKKHLKTGKTRAEFLDDSRPDWQTDHRPRARYLFFHYTKCLLDQAYGRAPASECLQEELQKPYWGTVGRYMKRKDLAALVEHIGHDYAGLVGEGLPDPEDDDPEEPSLAVATMLDDITKVNELESPTYKRRLAEWEARRSELNANIARSQAELLRLNEEQDAWDGESSDENDDGGAPLSDDQQASQED